MLTRLLPDQISKFWDVIKYAIEQSLPPIVGEHPDKMNRILSAALSGRVDVWASYEKLENSIRFEGIAVTKMIYDDASDTKNLLVYCMYGYDKIDDNSWVRDLEAVARYAASKNCAQIIGYTDVPYIVELAKELGAEKVQTFVAFNTKQTVQNLNDLTR